MGNKAVKKIKVNKERFMEVLKLRNCSIRKLGEAYEQIERTEKTIRRCLENGEMPPDLLNKIAKYLDVHPDYLSGVYDNKADKIENAYLRALSCSFIRPDMKWHSKTKTQQHFIALRILKIIILNA